MAKNKKSSKKVEKVTKSDKKSVDAVKKGKAKVVAEPAPKMITISEYAVEGEKPQWGAQLDALREADIAAGMTEKAARVQRASRVRKLKRGETLPEHGGLFDLDAVQGEVQQPEVEIVEPVEAELTKKQRKQLDKALKQQVKEIEATAQRQQEALKAAAEAEAAELARATDTAPKKGKKSKHQEVAEAEVESNTPTTDQLTDPANVDISHESAPKKQRTAEYSEIIKRSVGANLDAADESAPVTRTRTDPIRKALEEALIARDQTGERQVIELPRQYKVKNYHAQLIRKYGPDFEGLTGSESFDTESELFNITLTLPAVKVTRNAEPKADKKSKKKK